MAYYHILHQRRLDLKLSIQDVSSQTRLAPQYIEAIEEHNLDVFSDDFSFVRYFVHAYSNAIGVNWAAIASEVDEDIADFAHRYDMALTQAQKRMVEQMPSVDVPKRRTKRRKSRSSYNRHISKTSKSLRLKRKGLVRVLVLVGVCGLLALSLLNFVLNQVSINRQQKAEEERQSELDQKEKETEKLAKKRQKEIEAAQIDITESGTNAYIVSNIQSDMTELELVVTMPATSKVSVYKDNDLITTEDKTYTDTLSVALELSENCTFTLEIETYSDNEITLDGQTIQFDKTGWSEDTPATITFQIGEGNQNVIEEETVTDYSYDSDYSYSDESYYYDQSYYE